MLRFDVRIEFHYPCADTHPVCHQQRFRSGTQGVGYRTHFGHQQFETPGGEPL